ncbi:16S rRNA (pseudouridine(914)-N(1))-methyltransferase Nep1 [Thermoplasma acidophilum]|uniref:Ribosomal RNA small subunit methyltransferase Nep1 n=1 Tax=Thermoplasma acidophilum (strain ATCC 25905 / DSM 1728 / JCM 9062 / NBRC 15155 / AMRC-C165) TaxID=273075 RepID=NEP1_THEAC|nr:16S rRNA (pseudouridine(914)-N(1))-methyltransferase Nep1 [Thermoplasma acidophilum]Q9HJ48.2 RecName: Full=Ribosomal RNA small subunit methyltransferase Nep1; AltName: Full=16S rRNA (pseudouridine-N1-)-methyltransferase Nep1 [Thermoplasma acidophilum DSM 1728]MCY0851857.1 16S rRNA (pseudouridine(914)-N(1))-methyltransferase Nep1 [Thermoplasma acidophilum]
MLHLVIADAELETIPEEMQADPAIRRFAKKRNKRVDRMILDSNYMHTSIDRYFPNESKRRGRPDIIYLLLEMTQESILNHKNQLRTYVHTRNNQVIRISPITRMPKSYNRFIGLFEDLFEKRIITNNGKELLSMEESSLGDLINSIRRDRTILLHPKGEMRKPSEFISNANILIVIGGFSEGDFISDTSFINERYAIFDQELTIWSVANEMVANYERAVGLT